MVIEEDLHFVPRMKFLFFFFADILFLRVGCSSSPLDRRIKTVLLADSMTVIGMRPFDGSGLTKASSKHRKDRLLHYPRMEMTNDKGVVVGGGGVGGVSVFGAGGRRRSGSGKTGSAFNSPQLILGRLADKDAKQCLQTFGEPEWMVAMEHVDESLRCGTLEQLYPKDAETVLFYSDFFRFPRINNRLLGVFLMGGGERLFREKKLQQDLKLAWLLKNGVILEAGKV